jgi:hypothetical protein
MPVHPVRENGRIVGYQWGSSGKVYRGEDAEEKAEAQGRAAHTSGYRGGKARKVLLGK